ncbi:hypothetical protein DVH24_023932 [Malus domestica]|uniref:Uncharacterized protein n=1 Tax=Malus domestica TaxID=3750 RepID=A0A498JEZ7_MALDO|nr:hypothetical protein DVH24_023932 [Malus domestica]
MKPGHQLSYKTALIPHPSSHYSHTSTGFLPVEDSSDVSNIRFHFSLTQSLSSALQPPRKPFHPLIYLKSNSAQPVTSPPPHGSSTVVSLQRWTLPSRHKAIATTGVSDSLTLVKVRRNWALLLCFCSFYARVLFTNRWRFATFTILAKLHFLLHIAFQNNYFL